jgi:hypothetical protein
MKKYEYTTKYYKPSRHWTSKKYDSTEFDTALNYMGRKGWKLVNTTPVAAVYGATHGLVCTFKREAR